MYFAALTLKKENKARDIHDPHTGWIFIYKQKSSEINFFISEPQCHLKITRWDSPVPVRSGGPVGLVRSLH